VTWLLYPSVIADCGPLADPENGDVSLTDTRQDSTATYSCENGYEVSGVSMRNCQSSGIWSGSAPVCICKSSCEDWE
jgi:hypothetical protein